MDRVSGRELIDRVFSPRSAPLKPDSKTPMKVNVKLFGPFRVLVKDYDPERALPMEVPEKAEVRDLLSLLGIPAGGGGMVVSECRILRPDAPLKEGMVLSVFPVISGG